MKEKQLTKLIQLYCGELGWACFDVNVGRVQLKSGGWFSSGLPRGFPDLLILTNQGKTIFVEAKVKYNKPSPLQIRFAKFLKNNNHITFLVRSLEDFKLKIIKHNLI